MNEKETLTRKELYNLVWSNSLLSLSKKYNLTDVGLRKACIRMGIPLPQAGYWAKIKHGKKGDRFPLPTNYEGKETIDLPLRAEENSQHDSNPLKKLTYEIQNDPGLSFEVPERLTSKEPLILAAKERLTGKNAIQSYTYKGVVSCGGNELYIRVAPNNVGRALRFMDTLIKLLRCRDHSVMCQGNSTNVLVKGHGIKIMFREKLKKVIAKQHSWDNTEYHPTGILSFKQDGYYSKEWIDGKKV